MNIRASSVSKSIPKGMMHVCGTHLHYNLLFLMIELVLMTEQSSWQVINFFVAMSQSPL